MKNNKMKRVVMVRASKSLYDSSTGEFSFASGLKIIFAIAFISIGQLLLLIFELNFMLCEHDDRIRIPESEGLLFCLTRAIEG